MRIGLCSYLKLEGGERHLTDGSLQAHYVVTGRQIHPQGSKRLSENSFDGVSGGGTLGMSLANHQSQASRCLSSACRVSQGREDQKVSARNSPPGKGGGELFGAVQPRRRRKGGARHSVFGLVGEVPPPTPEQVNQTARRLRPLARRALITARPPRVFMRTRKPWVRLRRVTEGW